MSKGSHVRVVRTTHSNKKSSEESHWGGEDVGEEKLEH